MTTKQIFTTTQWRHLLVAAGIMLAAGYAQRASGDPAAKAADDGSFGLHLSGFYQRNLGVGAKWFLPQQSLDAASSPEAATLHSATTEQQSIKHANLTNSTERKTVPAPFEPSLQSRFGILAAGYSFSNVDSKGTRTQLAFLGAVHQFEWSYLRSRFANQWLPSVGVESQACIGYFAMGGYLDVLTNFAMQGFIRQPLFGKTVALTLGMGEVFSYTFLTTHTLGLTYSAGIDVNL